MPLFEFNRAIVDATAEFACAFKPQIAYYAAQGAEDQLVLTIRHIRENHPHAVVILDAKRGDVGSTADMYAREAFDRYGADAVTVNPYMGGDTLKPFLDRKDKGVIVLCKTSNPGSGDFQDLRVGARTLYETVAWKAQNSWNVNNNVALVVGATFPEQLAKVRAAAPDLAFLVPGVGAQGGELGPVVKSGLRADGLGLIINSSRGIIHADRSEKFAEAARRKAGELHEEINALR